jgi:glyoxalase family protein
MTSGIHHVTAIAGPARRTLDFYTRTLGLRLVKKTVNFDDPTTYHFYFGDEAGRPGTLLTFFPWAHAARGRLGVGESQEIAFQVPEGAIGYWMHRFVERSVPHEPLGKRFGETVLTFADPDGMRLTLVAVPGAEREPAWSDGQIPAEHAIRGLHGVTLLVADAVPTGTILTDVLGFTETGREGPTVRYRAEAEVGGIIDVRAVGDFPRGRPGAGSIHHVAFRATDDAAERAMANVLTAKHGLHVTGQKDRNYFRSVYFREPGGILFEIATDDPGFAIDEPATLLGRELKLPRFLEARRQEIEAVLPELG